MRLFCLFFAMTLSGLIQSQEELNLLGHWEDSTLVASNAHDNTYNEIWGLVVNGAEYAVIGSTFGTHFIDVSDPENPAEVARVPGKAQGRAIVHRDYHDMGNYLYAVCDEGPSSLQIMDYSNLPDTVLVMYDSDTLIQRSHNIFIDTSSAILYSLATRGTKIGGSPMTLLDIRNPLNPKHIGDYAQFNDVRAGHVHDAFVINDTAYLNCGYSGFAIVDFADPENPTTLSTFLNNEYPDAGYNHSGWRDVSGDYYYMADENHGFDLKVVDVTDHTAIEVAQTFDANSDDAMSIAHNPLVACDYLYVAYYYDGLQVYDISDPANPVRAYHYPTSLLNNDQRYKGAWGTYPFLPSGNILVSDMQRGLFVIEAVDTRCNTKFTTSIKEEQVALGLTPNPVDSYVMLPENIQGHSVVIFNAQGQIVYTCKSMTDKVNVQDLQSGIYFLRTNGKTYRMVKQ